jgi:hypothetical protein
MVFNSARRIAGVAAGILVLACASSVHAAFAYIQAGLDVLLPSIFTGTLDPVDTSPFDPIALNPGYLNNISGGSNGGATGFRQITDVPVGETEFVALAINVTDLTDDFAPHRLSSDNDPALAHIISDLNTVINAGYTAYAFNDVPQAYVGAAAPLAAGEAANGGQPFDILVADSEAFAEPNLSNLFWNFDFSGEIESQQDNIIALSITDIGAIPEPCANVLLVVCGGALLLARRPRTPVSTGF